LRNFGEDVAEILEYIPANFKVIRHVRPKFACTGCERVVEAPAPPRVIERGLAGPGLPAHVLVAKYADHCPLYRQSEIYAREGVDLDRSTLAGWVWDYSPPTLTGFRNSNDGFDCQCSHHKLSR
jgi:transposase